MKVLLSWIREFVDLDESADAVGRRLSMRGLALEGIEPDGTDALLDFDVTANRPDCLSMAGIAREIAVAFRVPFREPAGRLAPLVAAAADAGGATLPVHIEAPDLCARYVGAIADVRPSPSPEWMARRLEACGVRPINNVVDVTNYVLLELGHPMHAFDYTRLAGPAIVVFQDLASPSVAATFGEVMCSVYKGFGAAGLITSGSGRELDQVSLGLCGLCRQRAGDGHHGRRERNED